MRSRNWLIVGVLVVCAVGGLLIAVKPQRTQATKAQLAPLSDDHASVAGQSMDLPLDGPVRVDSRSRVAIRGRACRSDEGTLACELDGILILNLITSHGELSTTVPVRSGSWSLDAEVRQDLLINSLALAGEELRLASNVATRLDDGTYLVLGERPPRAATKTDLEGILRVRSGLDRRNMRLNLLPAGTDRHERRVISYADMTELSDADGIALHWTAGPVSPGEWLALVVPDQCLSRFAVPAAPKHFEEIQICGYAEVHVRVLDADTRTPLEFQEVSWLSSSISDLKGLEPSRVASVSNGLEAIFETAPGTLRLDARIGNDRFVRQTVQVNPGRNDFVMMKERESIVDLLMMDGDRAVSCRVEWWNRVQFEPQQGQQSLIRCVTSSLGDGRDSTRGSYSGLKGGAYRIRFPTIAGFETPAEITYHASPPSRELIEVRLQQAATVRPSPTKR